MSWVSQLKQRFAFFHPNGETDYLSRDNMVELLKAVFTPSDEKIEKVMMFFDMCGESEGITLPNFLNGMTLLYGDLGHLAASPKQKAASASPLSPPVMEVGSVISGTCWSGCESSIVGYCLNHHHSKVDFLFDPNALISAWMQSGYSTQASPFSLAVQPDNDPSPLSEES